MEKKHLGTLSVNFYQVNGEEVQVEINDAQGGSLLSCGAVLSEKRTIRDFFAFTFKKLSEVAQNKECPAVEKFLWDGIVKPMTMWTSPSRED